MLTHNHKKLYDRLNKNILDKPQIITVPTATIKNPENDNQSIKFGGYKAIVHYNMQKEEQHRKDKFNKRLRQLRQRNRREASRRRHEDTPISSLNRLLGLCWEIVLGK